MFGNSIRIGHAFKMEATDISDIIKIGVMGNGNPKFDRNKVSTLLKSISQQMNVESKKLSDAIKIGVKIDATSFMNATSQYAKTIESIGKALDEENKKRF